MDDYYTLLIANNKSANQHVQMSKLALAFVFHIQQSQVFSHRGPFLPDFYLNGGMPSGDYFCPIGQRCSSVELQNISCVVLYPLVISFWGT